MITQRYFVAMLLAVFAYTNGVSAGWTISDYARWSDEIRSLRGDTSRRAEMQPLSSRAMQRPAPTKSTPQVNADGHRHKSLQSCTYRGGPKTGTWTCR